MCMNDAYERFESSHQNPVLPDAYIQGAASLGATPRELKQKRGMLITLAQELPALSDMK
jgi:hypothetical protein